jgi:hypothetical protein
LWAVYYIHNVLIHRWEGKVKISSWIRPRSFDLTKKWPDHEQLPIPRTRFIPGQSDLVWEKKTTSGHIWLWMKFLKWGSYW